MVLSVQDGTVIRVTAVLAGVGNEPEPHIPPSTERLGILSYLSAAKVFAASSKKTGHSQGTEQVASPQPLTHKVLGYTSQLG